MTLVYAHKDRDEKCIFFLSDTKSHDPAKLTINGLLEPTVKCWPVSQNIVICFAGDVFSGQSIINELIGCGNVKYARSRLLDFHIAREQSVDFIVGDLRALNLYQISNGQELQTKHG